MSKNNLNLNEDSNNSHATTDTSFSSDIYEQITNCLQLQNTPNKDDIILDVLIHGRQSLIKYRSVSSSSVLSNATSNEELLDLLKKNVIDTWKTILLNKPEIKGFFDQMQSENSNVFNKIVERIAENGNRYKEPTSQILFLVLQLSFPHIIDLPKVLDDLWRSITVDGIESLRKFPLYIAIHDLDKQLIYEQDKTPLYLALQNYYNVKAAEIFQKNNICDSDNLYNSAANKLTRTGWKSGITKSESRIAPFIYEKLLRSISSEIKTNSPMSNSTGRDNYSQTLSSNTQPSHSSPLELTVQSIINYLQLNNNNNKDEIISALLKNGRQTLFQYEEFIIDQVFTIEKDWTKDQTNDTLLLRLLREYNFEKLQVLLDQRQPTLLAPIKAQKEDRYSNHFRNVEIRLAQYGTIYTNSSFILSFVLQLLFDGITDDCMLNENVFTNLFKCITVKGIHGAEEQEYIQYIAPNDLKEQIKNDQSMLHLALRTYFREEIEKLFSQHGISDRNQRYDRLADEITKNGWLKGIQSMKDEIPEVQYNAVYQIISNKLRDLSQTQAASLHVTSNPSVDQSNFITYPQLQLDSEPNEMQHEMKYALDLAIVNRHHPDDDHPIWPKEQVFDQFETEWTNKMQQLAGLCDTTKLLKDSIEYIHQKYNSQETVIEEKISIPMISDSTELDRETLAEQWIYAVCVEAFSLGDNCITNIEEDASPDRLDSPVIGENCIYINVQQLNESLRLYRDNYNEANTQATTTPDQAFFIPANQKCLIIEEMKEKMKNNISDSSNIFLVKKFFDHVRAEIKNLIDNPNSVNEINDELLEKIRRVVNQFMASVNNELAMFDLKLSPQLMQTVHSQTLVLLTILWSQKQKKEIDQQYIDLNESKLAFCDYFLELLVLDRD